MDGARLCLRCVDHIRTSVSAAQAWESLHEWRSDLLICDINMPGENGYSLIRRIRTEGEPRIRIIPAVAVTAYSRLEDRIKALSAGFQMHLAKPVEPAELIAIVASLTGRSAGA